MVVTLLVTNYMARSILIDKEILVNILFWGAFANMNVELNRLRPSSTLLKGFLREVVQSLPMATTTMTDFLVVKALPSYTILSKASHIE